MHAYIINLDSAFDRWDYVRANFRRCGIPITRIPAVNGHVLDLPVPEFSEKHFRLYHGKRTNKGEIGCYLSHVKCLEAFLASSHEFGIICEDDVLPQENLKEVLQGAIDYRDTWDILRLSGYHNPHPIWYARLRHGYSLSVNFSRLSGSGAYMVDRRAAQILAKNLLPMRVPFDHALDREWCYGLRAASLTPLPVDQEDHSFKTHIADKSDYKSFKLPWYRRYWTVFPYRAFNETARISNRLGQLRQARRFVQQSPHQSGLAGVRSAG